MAKMHERTGSRRKDRWASQAKFVKYSDKVPEEGPLSGEDALRLLDDLEDPRERAAVVARICDQVGLSGDRPSRSPGGAA